MYPDNDDKNNLPSIPAAGGGLPDLPAPADAGLSAAVRNALGSGREAAHLPARFVKTGNDIARRAKAEKPSVRTGAPRKAHIGPRSGHK